MNGDLWRVLAMRDPKGEFEVHVGVPHKVLDEATWRMFWDDLRSVTFALPVAIVLLVLGIHYGVAPLMRIAQEVASRTHRRLDPVCPIEGPSEVRPLIEALNGLFARLSHAFSREARFTSDCAHELRTPLAGIRTQVQVAMRARDEAARRHALGQALVAVDRCTHLVGQLLALARWDPEAAPLPHSRLDLNEVVRPVLEDLAPAALAKNLALEFDPAPRPLVSGNAEALAIMARNLVDNAIRYSPSGCHVGVRPEARDDEVCLVVEDEGPGIPAEERDRVFDRFYRAQGTDSAGCGLGLSIVQSIAQTHNARVSLRTPPSGRGLQVEVCFPATETEPAGRVRGRPLKITDDKPSKNR